MRWKQKKKKHLLDVYIQREKINILYLTKDQTQIIPSSEPEMRREPSSEKSMQFKVLRWARQVLSNFPLATCITSMFRYLILKGTIFHTQQEEGVVTTPQR